MLGFPIFDGVQNSQVPLSAATLKFREFQIAHFLRCALIHIVEEQTFAGMDDFLLAEIA
jgi:hypothetical protein